MRTLIVAFALALASPAVAKTCHKGCACGDSCIDCSKQCHKGGGSSSNAGSNTANGCGASDTGLPIALLALALARRPRG